MASTILQDVNHVKNELQKINSPLDDNNGRTLLQALQVKYGELLISFPDFSLENGVEKELWNAGFRTIISNIQHQMNNKNESGDKKEIFNWFVNAGIGFYMHLLNQICSTFNLDFPFRRKDSYLGIMTSVYQPKVPGVTSAKSSSKGILYLCQYCLIHIGDLARYKLQPKQAEKFYKHAVVVGPTSGHPYNQLALIEAGRGHRMHALFLYMRALSVPAPFPGAAPNLIQMLMKICDANKDLLNVSATSEGSQRNKLTKLSKDEYIRTFLHFYSILLLKGDTVSAREHLPQLANGLSTLIATTTLTKSSLIQMAIINIFAHSYFSGKIKIKAGEYELKNETEKFVEPESCKEEVLELIEELVIGMVASLILPIYTFKEAEVALTFIALPALLLNVTWLTANDMLSCKAFKNKQHVWPGFSTLVNMIQKPLKEFDSNKFNNVPLPEMYDLQGFLPMHNILSQYNYDLFNLSVEDANILRAYRFTELAKDIAMKKLDYGSVFEISQVNGVLHIKALANIPVEDVLHLEKLTLQPLPKNNKKIKEKVGILKPEGSLEKSKIEKSKPIIKIESDNRKKSHKVSSPLPRVKTRTNVALQAILKRNSTEGKQVKFETNHVGEKTKSDQDTSKSSNEPVKNSHGDIRGLLKINPQSDPSINFTLETKKTQLNHSNINFNMSNAITPTLSSTNIQNVRNVNLPIRNPIINLNSSNNNMSNISSTNLNAMPEPKICMPPPNISIPPPNSFLLSNQSNIQQNQYNIFPTNTALPVLFPTNDPLESASLSHWSVKIDQRMETATQALPSQKIIPPYMANFTTEADKIKEFPSQIIPFSNLSNSEWWSKNAAIRPNVSDISQSQIPIGRPTVSIPKQNTPTDFRPDWAVSTEFKTVNGPNNVQLPSYVRSVPPPNITHLFTRPPPPIRMPQAFEVSQTTQSPPVSNWQATDLRDNLRGNSTYTLFGPLGGPDSSSSSSNVHNQQNMNQGLWCGPSPLERLLGQKKFGSKDSSNFISK